MNWAIIVYFGTLHCLLCTLDSYQIYSASLSLHMHHEDFEVPING